MRGCTPGWWLSEHIDSVSPLVELLAGMMKPPSITSVIPCSDMCPDRCGYTLQYCSSHVALEMLVTCLIGTFSRNKCAL